MSNTITHTFDEWAVIDPSIAVYGPPFKASWGQAAWQQMDRATLDVRIATGVPPGYTPPPAAATVHQGDTIAVLDAANAPVAGSPGVITVTGGVAASAKLSV